jgi:Protein of unknown function (DUF4065)
MSIAVHNNRTLNWKKFKELVHYICEKAEDPSCLGKVKLNKVLWYSDIGSYLQDGHSITGETYIKRQHGPVSKNLLRAINDLVKEGKIARGKADHFGFMKNEYINIYAADKNAFSGSEMAIIDAAFEHVCMHHTATSVSDETHNVIWEAAEMGEEIPYETVWATSVGEIDESDIAWAQERLSAGV